MALAPALSPFKLPEGVELRERDGVGALVVSGTDKAVGFRLEGLSQERMEKLLARLGLELPSQEEEPEWLEPVPLVVAKSQPRPRRVADPESLAPLLAKPEGQLYEQSRPGELKKFLCELEKLTKAMEKFRATHEERLLTYVSLGVELPGFLVQPEKGKGESSVLAPGSSLEKL